MGKYRFDGKLVFGPPLYAAIGCDLVGTLLLVAGFFLDAERWQKALAIGIGAALLLVSSGLLLLQVLRHGKRAPNS